MSWLRPKFFAVLPHNRRPRYCYFCSLILAGKLSIDVTMMYLFNTNKIIYCDTSFSVSTLSTVKHIKKGAALDSGVHQSMPEIRKTTASIPPKANSQSIVHGRDFWRLKTSGVLFQFYRRRAGRHISGSWVRVGHEAASAGSGILPPWPLLHPSRVDLSTPVYQSATVFIVRPLLLPCTVVRCTNRLSFLIFTRIAHLS